LNVLQRIAGIALGVVFFVLAFIFASVLLAVAGVVALLVWAWFWWRTRHLPRRGAEQRGGTVIEGEYRVEREVKRLDDDDAR
jgi:O-antigen/teichoic acid export membrane protein